MIYKYFDNQNFEDFSSGRVLYHKTSYSNYPVRLAGETFMRCLEVLGKTKDEVCVYDPCCGGGYMLTVLGFLCGKNIHKIYGSDILEEAVSLAKSNINLLTVKGLDTRKNQLEKLYNELGKQSQKDALNSIEYLSKLIKAKSIKTHIFNNDILNKNSLNNISFSADIVITDVPYGNLISWSDKQDFALNILLNNLIPIIHKNSIIAITHDKNQKINNPNFIRVQKFQVGKRKIELFMMK